MNGEAFEGTTALSKTLNLIIIYTTEPSKHYVFLCYVFLLVSFPCSVVFTYHFRTGNFRSGGRVPINNWASCEEIKYENGYLLPIGVGKPYFSNQNALSIALPPNHTEGNL